MYDCELHNDKACTDFVCKEPCEFKAAYGFCHDRCTKVNVCTCCFNWKNEEMKVEYVDRYPIGTKVRLSDDDPEDGPREVVGYKQIHNFDYLIFKDGSTAYVGRVAG